jgi:hypothetical protein
MHGEAAALANAVEPADAPALQSDIWRQWLVVFALLLIAGIFYVVYE